MGYQSKRSKQRLYNFKSITIFQKKKDNSLINFKFNLRFNFLDVSKCIKLKEWDDIVDTQKEATIFTKKMN